MLIQKISNNILVHILKDYLTVKDVINLAMTCKSLFRKCIGTDEKFKIIKIFDMHIRRRLFPHVTTLFYIFLNI